jgi:hypothetical protein
MASRKAFVFSLDSFVAFSIAIVIIYSLIYFSSIPYGYYGTLMQAHYLAKDTLVALSETQNFEQPEVSELGYVVSQRKDEGGAPPSSSQFAAKQAIGPLIPEQFGYKVEIQQQGTDTWDLIYDTKDGGADEHHDKTYDKVQASSQIVAIGYHTFATGEEVGYAKNPYGYMTCKGDLTQCGTGATVSNPHDSTIMALVRLTVYT